MPHSPQYLRAYFNAVDQIARDAEEKKWEEEKKEKKREKQERSIREIDPQWVLKGTVFPAIETHVSHPEKMELYGRLEEKEPIAQDCGPFEFELLEESNVEILQQHFGGHTEDALDRSCRRVSSLMGHEGSGEIRFFVRLHPGEATRVTGFLEWDPAANTKNAGFVSRFLLAQASIMAYQYSIMERKQENIALFIRGWYANIARREYRAARNNVRVREMFLEDMERERERQAQTMAGGSSRDNVELVRRQAEWAKPAASKKISKMLADLKDVDEKALLLADIVQDGKKLGWLQITKPDRREAVKPLAENVFADVVKSVLEKDSKVRDIIQNLKPLLQTLLVWDKLLARGVRYGIIKRFLEEWMVGKKSTTIIVVNKNLQIWEQFANELEIEETESEGEEEGGEKGKGKGKEVAGQLATKVGSMSIR